MSILAPDDPNDDGDEPYTPFDDDDEPFIPPSYKPPTATTQRGPGDDLESQMEIINRQIEQRQLEIQNLAQQKAMELNEEQATRIFEAITVPHDLSEILSKINEKQESETKPMEVDNNDEDDEYVPTPMGSMEYRAAASYSAMSQPAPIVNSMMDIDERIAMFQAIPPAPGISGIPNNDQPSRLASMTEADLMKLVPDGALEAPPAPIISTQPSIPGLEDDDYEMN